MSPHYNDEGRSKQEAEPIGGKVWRHLDPPLPGYKISQRLVDGFAVSYSPQDDLWYIFYFFNNIVFYEQTATEPITLS